MERLRSHVLHEVKEFHHATAEAVGDEEWWPLDARLEQQDRRTWRRWLIQHGNQSRDRGRAVNHGQWHSRFQTRAISANNWLATEALPHPDTDQSPTQDALPNRPHYLDPSSRGQSQLHGTRSLSDNDSNDCSNDPSFTSARTPNRVSAPGRRRIRRQEAGRRCG